MPGCLAIGECEWSHHRDYLGHEDLFYTVLSCHLFLISSTSVIYCISVLYRAHLCMKCSLGTSNFLEEISSLSHSVLSPPRPLLFFSSISLHWLLRKAFVSLLAILWNSAFRCLYLFFLLGFSLLFFSQLFVRPPQIAILLFLHFFSMGMVLIPVSCTMSQTSVHNSSGTPSIRSSLLNLFLTSTVWS